MAPKKRTMRKMSHLCLINLLVITQCVHVIEMTPVCGRTGDSSSTSASKSTSSEAKSTDKIYFLDQQQSIHTEEINGVIVTCFADGTIINATSAAAATASNDDGPKSKIKFENGNCRVKFHIR